MTKKQGNSFDLKEVEAFMKNVPEDRKVLANSLFDKLAYLNKILCGLEKLIDGGDVSSTLIKNYNDTIQRYGIVCKQLVSILPKPTESYADDPLLNFIKDGPK